MNQNLYATKTERKEKGRNQGIKFRSGSNIKGQRVDLTGVVKVLDTPLYLQREIPIDVFSMHHDQETYLKKRDIVEKEMSQFRDA